MKTAERVKGWRLRAKEVRRMADYCASSEARLTLVMVADDYDSMADQAEQRADRKRVRSSN